jgi:hypothetical protein
MRPNLASVVLALAEQSDGLVAGRTIGGHRAAARGHDVEHVLLADAACGAGDDHDLVLQHGQPCL